MGNVKVRIKPAIAAAGCGFCDIEGKQEIFPPRDGAGRPVTDAVFDLSATPFVEQKIASGELVLIARAEEAARPSAPRPGAVVVSVNGEHVAEIEIAADATEEDILAAVDEAPDVKNVLAGKKVKGVTISDGKVEIKVK